MEDGPPIFRQDFSCPALLVVSSVSQVSFYIRDYHPLWSAFPDCSAKSLAITNRLLRFRSPLLSESRLMSFPRATEMFQFTRFASHSYVFTMRYPLLGRFPHSEISGSKLICQLPEAYRRLSRPSSPIIAKASTICSYSLDPITLNSLTRYKANQGIARSFTSRVMPSSYFQSFDSKLKFILTQSKKFLSLAARSALNLYECAVSANNADSTL